MSASRTCVHIAEATEWTSKLVLAFRGRGLAKVVGAQWDWTTGKAAGQVRPNAADLQPQTWPKPVGSMLSLSLPRFNNWSMP
eukprot:2512601-Amphidinium_carterae.1